jgi:hypothetical protein
MNAKSMVYLVIGVLAGAAALPARSQSSTNQTSDGDMMATMMAMAKPGDNHKQFESLAGEWTYTVKWWMNPQMPPSESTGTTVSKLVMGGRYLVVTNFFLIVRTAKLASQDFWGFGRTGIVFRDRIAVL